MPSPQTSADPVSRPPAAEGPLAHAARTTAESAYLAGLDDRHRMAWERASGARPERTSKRLLVALSHTIEKAVMSGPLADPTVVVALFQRLEFFDREREVYERMAAAGVDVVVGFISGQEHEAPADVRTVLLDPEEPLADEWTVVALGPQSGAFLVATDQHAHDPDEREGEAGRVFSGRWGYSQAQAASELARLRLSLGDRLDPAAREVVDRLLGRAMPSGGQPAMSAGSQAEVWATTSLHHMIDAMRTAHTGTRELRDQLADAHSAVAARTAATVDPASGLPDRDFLARWAGPAQDGSPLTVGLALFDVAEMGGRAVAADARAAYHASHQVAAALTQPLGPVDAAVRLSSREFLIVVPGASTRHLAELCDAIAEQLELASGGYPDVPLRATIASTVTSARPLPLGDLQESLGSLGDDDGPVEGGRAAHGERIVVASSRLHAPAGTERAGEERAREERAGEERAGEERAEGGDGRGGGGRPARSGSVTPLARHQRESEPTGQQAPRARASQRPGDDAVPARDPSIDPRDPLGLHVQGGQGEYPAYDAGPVAGSDGTDVPRPREQGYDMPSPPPDRGL